MELEGGKADFNARLDELFTKGYYDHGNEPSHAITYLYDYSGEAWKTQEHVAEIRAKWYQDRPDGLAGNDDAGQMSAWYLFSALGFYPVTPGIPAYEIGTPLLPSATLHLSSGKQFRIRAQGVSAENRYVQSAHAERQTAGAFLDSSRRGSCGWRTGLSHGASAKQGMA